MTYVVAAALGGNALLNYLGSQKQAGAAENAADIQAAAAREQMAFQKEVFERLQQQQAPYRQAGYTALNRINALLGLPPAYTTREPMTGAVSSAGIPTAAAPGGGATVPGAISNAFVLGNQGGALGAIPSGAARPAKPVTPGGATMYYRGGPSAAAAAAPATAVTRGKLSDIGGKITGGVGKITGGIGKITGGLEKIAMPVLTGGVSLLPGASNIVDKITGNAGKLAGGLAVGGGLGVIDPLTGGLLGGAASNALSGGGHGLFGGLFGDLVNAAQQAVNAPPNAGAGTGPAPLPEVAPGYETGEGMMGFGAFARPFTAQDLTANLAPNYEFMRQQGLGAVRQGANVGGGGSNMQRSAIKFAEDYAKNAYQDALNNYRLQQGDIFNRLTNLTGTGQTAQQSIGSTAGQLGSNISQLGIGAAQAQAAGQVGAANAMAGGLGNISSLLGTYGLIKGLS